MARFLVLRLAGPLMSFGGVTVDENRPTHALPTQSQLTGLLANALGWRAREGERHNRLQARLVFGARQDRAGQVLVDYQNAHVSQREVAWRWRTDVPLVRSGGSAETNAQRYRHYIADGVVSVALTLDPADEAPRLDDLAAALLRPARPLFLGRVSCPPSGPIFTEEVVEADSLPEALRRMPLAARARPAAAGEFLAEWPARGAFAGDGTSVRQVVERADLRDWVDNLHAGWRLVATGVLAPTPAPGPEAS
ncbi:MAG: type I-E CRISPR-associated protein Cas5/CasD [Desulfovibrionaceae bacterium]